MASTVVWIAKFRGETKKFNFDFTSQLRSGESLANLTVEVAVWQGEDATPSAMLSGVPTIAGAVASQHLIEGEPGVIYTVTCAAVTTLGSILQMAARLAVFPSVDITPVIPPPDPPDPEMDVVGDLVPSGASTRIHALPADGSAVSRVTYANLFSAIGTTFGAGDGMNTFNLPDVRGRLVIGSGTGSGLTNRVLGTSGGSEDVTLTGAQSGVPAHTHGASADGEGASVYVTGDVHDFASYYGLTYNYSNDPGHYEDVAGATLPSDPIIDLSGMSITVDANTAANAASSHTNMPPWLAVKWFIIYE